MDNAVLTGWIVRPVGYRNTSFLPTLVTLLAAQCLVFGSCTVVVSTSELTEGDEALGCVQGEKICPVNSNEQSGAKECMDSTSPVNGCMMESCRSCQVPGAVPRCTSSGLCGISICLKLRGDCDGDESNGCEIDLGGDELNCGACNTPCDRSHGIATCVAGVCQLVVCVDSFADCDGVSLNGCEVDLDTSISHCGACGIECTTQCVEGVCE